MIYHHYTNYTLCTEPTDLCRPIDHGFMRNGADMRLGCNVEARCPSPFCDRGRTVLLLRFNLNVLYTDKYLWCASRPILSIRHDTIPKYSTRMR